MEEVEGDGEVETVPNWAKSSKLADLLTWTCLLMLQFSSPLDFWSLQKTPLPFSSSFSSLFLLVLPPSQFFLVSILLWRRLQLLFGFRRAKVIIILFSFLCLFFLAFSTICFLFLPFFFFAKEELWKRECGMRLVKVYYAGKSQNVLKIVFLDTKQHISCLRDARKWTTPSYFILYTNYNMFIYAFALAVRLIWELSSVAFCFHARYVPPYR